jgi:CRP-like cAMP-binding protein
MYASAPTLRGCPRLMELFKSIGESYVSRRRHSRNNSHHCHHLLSGSPIIANDPGLGLRSNNVMFDASRNPRQNHLLAALPQVQWERWRPHLEYVDMPLGQVLYEPGGTLRHVYFPTTAIVSLLYVMQNGESAEIAVVGNDGLVGVFLFMGGDFTSSRALVQSAGGAYRLTAQLMKEEFDRGGPVLHLLLRYTQALITQMVQTAACNKHHSLDQQLCRWLLLSLDRLQGTEMVMTQTLIAHMLGVSLKGATEGALKLQTAGLIDYAQGRIRVVDRAGLERRVCECYAVVKKEYDRLLPERLAA